MPLGKSLIGGKLIHIATKYGSYTILDEDLEATDQEQLLVNEIVFKFEHERTLQVSTVDYTIEDNTIQEIVYDIQGELLLSVDKIFEIEELS